MAAEEPLDLGALKRFTDDGTRTRAAGFGYQALRVLLGLMGAAVVWYGLDWIGHRITAEGRAIRSTADAQDFHSTMIAWRMLALVIIGIVTAVLSRYAVSLIAGSLLLLAGMIAGGFWTVDVLFETFARTELGVFLSQGAHNIVVQVCFTIWFALGVTNMVAGRRRRSGPALDRVGDGI
jgi:hypothetical protein